MNFYSYAGAKECASDWRACQGGLEPTARPARRGFRGAAWGRGRRLAVHDSSFRLTPGSPGASQPAQAAGSSASRATAGAPTRSTHAAGASPGGITITVSMPISAYGRISATNPATSPPSSVSPV
jgi:hypothetical protein